jgi:hypothetical protein
MIDEQILADHSLRLPPKKLFSSLLGESQKQALPKASIQTSSTQSERQALTSPRLQPESPKHKSSSVKVSPTRKIEASPDLNPKVSQPAARPIKEPSFLAFAHMEKLVSSIDPGLKVYSEDQKVERKQIFVAFESEDFYSRLKGAIETHIGKVTEGKLDDPALNTKTFDLYLVSRAALSSKEAQALTVDLSLTENSAYSAGSFRGQSVVVLKEPKTYDDKELKKVLWNHLKTFAL